MIDKQRPIFMQDETGADTETVLCRVTDAEPADITTVLTASLDDNGRSQYKWFRLQNGDLILGVFPCGDTYIEVSERAGV